MQVELVVRPAAAQARGSLPPAIVYLKPALSNTLARYKMLLSNFVLNLDVVFNFK